VINALPRRLEGERVVLTPHPDSLEHAEAMLLLAAENKEHIGKWRTTILRWTSLDACREYVRISAKLWDDGKAYRYAIFLKETGEFVGEIKIIPSVLNQDDAAEVGFFTFSRFARKGYASEAIYTVEKELFSSGIFRIEMDAAEGNEASMRIILRTGHHFEGVKRASNNPAWAGRRIYMAMFSKLATDEFAPKVDVDAAMARLRFVS
jgi:ribosomal-protein-alanine N-acetyltransferase